MAPDTAADETLASAAAAAARLRIQQATPPNSSYVDHSTGRIRTKAVLPPFWEGLQQTQGWLEHGGAQVPSDADSSPDLCDIISNYTGVFVCNPLVRIELEHDIVFGGLNCATDAVCSFTAEISVL
jgi:hypothetical protein